MVAEGPVVSRFKGFYDDVGDDSGEGEIDGSLEKFLGTRCGRTMVIHCGPRTRIRKAKFTTRSALSSYVYAGMRLSLLLHSGRSREITYLFPTTGEIFHLPRDSQADI